MSKDNGGPVHPTMTMSDTPGCYHLYQSEGISVRAYLAGEAIKVGCFTVEIGDYKGLAREAVKLADALMEELSR